MTGGERAVRGDVENFCGIRQAGGLILVKEEPSRCGSEMNGGTIAVVAT